MFKRRLPVFALLILLVFSLSVFAIGCGESKVEQPKTDIESEPQLADEDATEEVIDTEIEENTDVQPTENDTDNTQPAEAQSQDQSQNPSSQSSEPSTSAPAPEAPTQSVEQQSQDTIVYITGTGEKYHRDGCRHLKKSKIKTTLSAAKSNGYKPCGVCNPPS